MEKMQRVFGYVNIEKAMIETAVIKAICPTCGVTTIIDLGKKDLLPRLSPVESVAVGFVCGKCEVYGHPCKYQIPIKLVEVIAVLEYDPVDVRQC